MIPQRESSVHSCLISIHISLICDSFEGSTLYTFCPACSSQTISLSSSSRDTRMVDSPLDCSIEQTSSEIPMPSSVTNTVPLRRIGSFSERASSTSTCHLRTPARGLVCRAVSCDCSSVTTLFAKGDSSSSSGGGSSPTRSRAPASSSSFFK